MNHLGLDERSFSLVHDVLARYQHIDNVRVFGSRAKGTQRPESDIDLVVYGDLDDLDAMSILRELDELPLPYQFDVHVYSRITYRPLREHIDRVGVALPLTRFEEGE